MMDDETHGSRKVKDTLNKYVSFIMCGILIAVLIYFAYLMMEVIANPEATRTQLIAASSGIFCCGLWAGVYTLIIAQDIKKKVKMKKIRNGKTLNA